eukprot:5475218-Pyramimonas_sp.AAC.1
MCVISLICAHNVPNNYVRPIVGIVIPGQVVIALRNALTTAWSGYVQLRSVTVPFAKPSKPKHHSADLCGHHLDMCRT